MDERLPERKRLRLAQYDYATPGTYFITICTREKKCTLGQVDDSVGQAPCACPTVGTILNGFKSRVTKTVRAEGRFANALLWQPRYYDHVVRDEDDYERIWDYIENNPARWRDDELYSER